MNIQYVYYAYWAILRMRYILYFNSDIDIWYFVKKIKAVLLYFKLVLPFGLFQLLYSANVFYCLDIIQMLS